VPFIAMEYIDGKNLKLTLGGQPMAVDLVVDLGIQIAEYLCDRARAGQGARFWLGQARTQISEYFGRRNGSRRCTHTDPRPDQCRHGGRHRRLYVAGAGSGPGGRRPLGHLLARGVALRNDHRGAGVCRFHPGRDIRQDC
jgi:hypothetical protein